MAHFIAHARSAAMLIMLSTVLYGIAAGQATQEQQPQQTPPVDPFIQCLRDLAAEPQFEQLSHKLPLADLTSITFPMLAEESRPTPKERQEIADWFKKRDKCRQGSDALHRTQWPPEIYEVSTQGDAGIQAIGVDLYNGKITFGETNKRLQQLRSDILAKLVPVIKKYQAELVAEQAAAEERKVAAAQQAQQREEQVRQYGDAQAAQQELIRQQRAALFLNYMRAMQPKPLQMPPPPAPTYNTNCYTYGNTTNCTTH